MESNQTVGRLQILDIGVIVVYFVIVIGFGLWVSSNDVFSSTDIHAYCLRIRCYIRPHNCVGFLLESSLKTQRTWLKISVCDSTF